MAQAWAGKKTLAEVQDTALSYFFHPERVCLFAAGDTVPDAQVLFSKNSAALDAKDKQVLAQVKDILDGDSALVVDIWAYANDGGSLAADRKLSSRRGDAVRDYLVNDLKVPRSQIGTVVPGSTGPSVLDSYQTDEAQAARGRRVEFRVVKAGGGTQSQRSIMHKIETWSKQPTNQKAIKQAGSEEWAWGQVKKVEEELKKLNKAQKDPWGAAVEFYKQLEKLREDADAKKLKEGAKKVGEGAKDVAEGAKRKYEAAKEDAKVIKDKELPSAKKKAEEVGKKALDAEEPVPGAKQTQKALEGVLGEKK
jgi:outer membrane protein OmpA-like peptidoglycan-associated protein